MEEVKYYRIPVYKSEEDSDNNIYYIKTENTWEDAFCGTYDECCDFLSQHPIV